MASKGSSRHIKSLASSRYASIERKAHGRYMTKPGPGRHTLDSCIALSLAVRRSGHALTALDSDRVIKLGHITVNGRTVKEPKYPVGLGDSIGITPEGVRLHMGINERGQLELKEASKEELAKRTCKVVGKYKTDGNALFIRLHDGTNVKSTQEINVNDSVLISAANKIEKVLPLKKEAKCLVIDGVHVGTSGTISELKAGHMHKSQSAVIESQKGRFETLVRNLMVIS
jgi:small subunit ribosomal protein S4e